MKATLPDHNVFNGHNWMGEKELIQRRVAVVLHKGKMREAVIVNVHGTNARNYVSVWAHNDLRSYAGHGWAGGYGYHRPSAAMGAALKSAGITLDEDIDGRGSSAMDEAMKAICHALGFKTVFIV